MCNLYFYYRVTYITSPKCWRALLQDLRAAVRLMRRQASFSTFVVLTLRAVFVGELRPVTVGVFIGLIMAAALSRLFAAWYSLSAPRIR
jgi:hypothetical protein